MIKSFRFFIPLGVFLLSFPLFAQQKAKPDSLFLNHLIQQNLEQERIAYYKNIDLHELKQQFIAQDICLLSAKYNDSTLINQYQYFVNDTNDLMMVFYAGILLNTKSLCSDIIQELTLQQLSKKKLLLLSELMEFVKENISINAISEQFYTTTKQIHKLQHKSVYLATVLSILIPGAGKFYLMQTNEASSTMVLNLIAAAPVIELIIRFGILSTGVMLGGLVFLPVYIANIYGTIRSKKVLLKKLNTQLKNEVLDYCTFQLRH